MSIYSDVKEVMKDLLSMKKSISNKKYSTEEEEIVVVIFKDNSKHLITLQTSQTPSHLVNSKRRFIDLDNPHQSSRAYIEAANSLVQKDVLVTHLNNNGAPVYELTSKGYELAEKLLKTKVKK